MPYYSDPLRLDDLGNRTFRLVIPLTYFLDTNEVIIVPEGFITDLASVPKIFWNIIPPHGPYGKAAVIHDACYQTKGFYGRFTRKQSDQIFLEGMECLGVNWITRHTMYRSVRLYSWRFWNETRKKRIDRMIKKTGLRGLSVHSIPRPSIQ